jgi:hypothetical protein
MLDADTVSELKVLENPKFNGFVKRAREDREFLDALLAHAESDDWLLRWGISNVIVQVSKRSPELLRETIPLLLSRLLYEDRHMVNDNFAQTLVHLSRFIPEDFVRQGAHTAFVQYLKPGEDHKTFDGLRVLENISHIRGDFVRSHIPTLEKLVMETENPLIEAETIRVLGRLRALLDQ